MTGSAHCTACGQPVAPGLIRTCSPQVASKLLTCQTCGADRAKEPCRGDIGQCSMRGIAGLRGPDKSPYQHGLEAAKGYGATIFSCPYKASDGFGQAQKQQQWIRGFLAGRAPAAEPDLNWQCKEGDPTLEMENEK